ncbi:WG repeat-containing protein [Tepidibacter mesophilus]|uniref:WG repeat-containing protein n=1 Tax=Tepidibacter mesophilus TaxID=655607 RepID=UPI000C07B9AE|nr:WG repeat-containing protein [Tepidibacter mesophilus]
MFSKLRLCLLGVCVTCISVFILCGCTNAAKIEVSKKLSDFEICKPESDGQFHDGLLWGAYSDGTSVYYNYNGNIAFPLPSNIKPISDFYNERAVVVDNKTGLCGYIDTKGKIVIPCKYKNASIFSQELAYVDIDDSRPGVFIDKKGNIVTTLTRKYSSDYFFSEGLAIVYDLKNGKQGCINKSGELVIPCKYTFIRPISEGLSVVENDKGQYGYMNKEGKIVIPFQYKGAGDFSEGLAVVENDKGQCGYINKDGKIAIPFQYKDAGNFSEGLASVTNNKGKWGFIDKTATLVIPYQNYTKVSDFKEGICLVGIEDNSGGKFGYIDSKGKLLTQLEYRIDSTSFKEGKAVAVKDDRTAIIIEND